MSITTGAELATAVANWMQRTDLTARIPEAVSLAEAKLFRLLRNPDMETKNATFSITGEYVAVPTGFLAARNFYLNNSTKDVLAFMPDDTQVEYFGAASGTPKYYSVSGGNFHFGPVPDATYTATLVYFVAPSSVSAGGSAVNWILTTHPDAYLYASLAEMCGFAQDYQAQDAWGQKFDRCVAEIKNQGARQRWGGNSMAVRPA